MPVYYRLLDGLQEVARLDSNALIEPSPTKGQTGLQVAGCSHRHVRAALEELGIWEATEEIEQ